MAEVAGVLSFVPWGIDGFSLDVMRRHPDADNGVTEFMVTGLMAAGREIGIRRVSLNFAVFRSAFEEGARIGAGPDRAALAAAAAGRVPLVADRVAVPVQREVPTRNGGRASCASPRLATSLWSARPPASPRGSSTCRVSSNPTGSPTSAPSTGATPQPWCLATPAPEVPRQVETTVDRLPEQIRLRMERPRVPARRRSRPVPAVVPAEPGDRRAAPRHDGQHRRPGAGRP